MVTYSSRSRSAHGKERGTRAFRFGVSLLATGSRSAWQRKARQAEDLGYDVLLVPDHLGMLAPFPALVSAAEVTSMRVGTFVLNSGLYRPAVMARDVADTDQLTDGRFELGLGAGYQDADFRAAGLPLPSRKQRVEQLARTIRQVRRLLTSADHRPMVRQKPHPPLMIAGRGARILGLAGREADIVGFPLDAGVKPGTEPERALAERAALVRREAGERADDLELNLLIAGVAVTPDEPDLPALRSFLPGLSDAEILRLPNVLIGSKRQIAEQLRHLREAYGISYFSVVEPHMAAFARVLAHLR